jgi:hypothetical protein
VLALKDDSKAKIKLRKCGWYWYVLLPREGIPELLTFLNFTDALAKVFFETRRKAIAWTKKGGTNAG